MNDDLDLSRELTRVVATVPGVGDVFPSGTLAQTVTLTLVNASSDDETDDAKVAVDRSESGRLIVTVTIGVADGYAAQATLRAVDDALRTHLSTRHPLPETALIEVKVSRIEAESRTK